jgi:hypothetical protein
MVRARPEKHAEWYAKASRAAELRRAGYQWAEIAIEVGYSGRDTAYTSVKRLLKEHQSLAYEQIGLYRQESLDRLMELLKAVWPNALAGSDKHVTQARLIISQIGDLTGEKAPVQLQIGESDVDRLLRDALDEFGRRTAELDRQAGAVQEDQARDG